MTPAQAAAVQKLIAAELERTRERRHTREYRLLERALAAIARGSDI